MPRIIQRKVTTIQIITAEIIWAEEEKPATPDVKKPIGELTAPAETGKIPKHRRRYTSARLRKRLGRARAARLSSTSK